MSPFTTVVISEQALMNPTHSHEMDSNPCVSEVIKWYLEYTRSGRYAVNIGRFAVNVWNIRSRYLEDSW